MQIITKQSIEMHFNITSRSSSISAQVFIMHVGIETEDMCKYKDKFQVQLVIVLIYNIIKTGVNMLQECITLVLLGWKYSPTVQMKVNST